MRTILETRDLVTNFYTYEGVVKALNQVSITIDHGSTYGLVGESGCGKSVFVRSVMRIVQAPGCIEAGEILLFPEESEPNKILRILEQSEAEMEHLRGNLVSMVFQEPNAALNPIMRIGDQISESFLFHQTEDMCRTLQGHLENGRIHAWAPWRAYLKRVFALGEKKPENFLLKISKKLPLFGRWKKHLTQEALRRSIEIITKLGIAHPERIVGQYPHNLSGGMKQRVVIAIALACNPVLLIADEATSNLDVTIQAQILELLRQLKKETISSVLLITHDLGVVAETCDRVGVMYAGNLCETADVRDLFKAPKHPYTRALLTAVPKFTSRGRLESIEGNVPNLVHPPDGCRFHPRCPRAMDICRHTRPALRERGKNHHVACYLYGTESAE